MVKLTLYPTCVMTSILGYVSKEMVDELRKKGDKALLEVCYDDESDEAFWSDAGVIHVIDNLPAYSLWSIGEDYEYNLRNMFRSFYFTECMVKKGNKEVSIYDKIFDDSDGFPAKSKIIMPSVYYNVWTKESAIYDSECDKHCTQEFLKEAERIFWGKPIGITSKSGKSITGEGSYVFEDLDDIDPEKLLFVIGDLEYAPNEPFGGYKYLAGIYYGDDIDKIVQKSKEKGRLTQYNFWFWLEKWIDDGIKSGTLNVKKAEIEDEFDTDLSRVYDYTIAIEPNYDEYYYCDYVEVLRDLYD